jgi:hypothetical protein
MKSSLFQRMFAGFCVLLLIPSLISAQSPPEQAGSSGPPSSGSYGSGSESYGSESYGSEGMSEYGSEGSGGYGQPAAIASPALTLKMDLKRIMGLMPLKSLSSALPPGAVSGTPPLYRDAMVSYQNGDLSLALAHYYANMVVNPETAQDALDAVQYSATLRRPVWSIRIGTAIAVRGDEGAEPSPIQAGVTANQFAGGEEFRGQQSEEFGGPPSGSEYEGGTEGYEGMSDGSIPGSQPNTPSIALPTINRPMLDKVAEETMKKSLGLVADNFAKEYESRYRSGNLGKALVDVPVKVEEPQRPAFGAAPPEKEDPSKVYPTNELIELFEEVGEPQGCWQPGLVFLGEIGSDEAITLAKQLDLDFIVQFDVILKESKTPVRGGNPEYANPGRAGGVENISRARLIHVDSGKALVSSKPMNNLEVSNLVQRKQFTDNDAYVADAMKVFWMTFDRTTEVKPLPPLTADLARRRVGQIVADVQGNPLIGLSEVRVYQKNGWLTESEVETAFDVIGGSKGLTMLYGPDQEKRAKVREIVKMVVTSTRAAQE